MRLRPIRRLLPVLILGICFAYELSAQTTTSGGLTGVVTDESGAVIPDAKVEIQDGSKGTNQSTTTDREGVFRFFFLAPARYLLTVTHDGFRKESRAVNVLLGPPVSVNATLKVAKASSEVTVTGEAPLIHTENGDASTTMNQKQIAEIPNPGNDLTYFAQTAPGVVMNTDIQGFANFSILGMPGTSYLYTLDGMNDNDNGDNLNRSGPLGLLLGQNQVQEATVVSTGYSGQFGGAAGGNVNYITKSGGNSFHGNALYYWNGRVLNANDWILNAQGSPRPFDIANQWAGAIGGPIQKDKLFFFFDTEGLRLLIPQLNEVQIPSPQFEAATLANIDSRFGSGSASGAFYRKIFDLYNAAPGASSATSGSFFDHYGCTGFTGLGVDPRTKMPLPCAQHFFSTRGRPMSDTLTSGRLDWNVGKNDRAFVGLQYDRGLNPIVTDPISSAFDADFNQPWWQGRLIETHMLNSSAANQFLVAGSYMASVIQEKNPSLALSTFPTFLNFSVPGTFNTLGGQDINYAYGWGIYHTQYQLSDDIVKTRGSHKFGLGANFARNYWSQFPDKSATIGMLTPQTLDAFYQGGIDPVTPSADFTVLAQSFTSQNSLLRISFLNFGLYGQDEWHLRSNLAITLALRAEHYSNPVCENSCFARLAGPFDSVSHDPNQPYNQALLINQKRAFQSSDNVLWSPRFSFAWQPLGVSSNTVLRGGVGVFYDPVAGAVPDLFEINPPIFNSYTIVGDNLTPNEKTSLFQDAKASNVAFVNGFSAGQTLAQIQSTITSFYPTGFSPPGVITATMTLHAPQYQRWSLELQKAFGASSSVSIGYFGHHGIHQLALNNSANAYCNPAAVTLASGARNPCFGFTSTLPLSVPDQRFNEATQINTNAGSNYNGIIVSFERRFTAWGEGMFQANYTYGHAFDEVSNGGLFSFTTGSSLSPQDPSDLRGSYGPAEYDVRHSFNANYVWEPPVKALWRGRGWDSLMKGWQVSGTIFARTGFPYTVFDVAESGNLVSNNYFGTIYAVPAGPLGSGAPCGEGAAIPNAPHPCLPAQLLADAMTPNPGALFLQSGCETGFNSGHLPGPAGPCGGPLVSFSQGRNRFRGPSYFNTDFAIMKNTRVPGWENAALGIGFQFFNFFNHPNFGFPSNNSSDSGLGYGKIFYLQQPPTSILGAGLGGDVAPRMIQLKAQLQF